MKTIQPKKKKKPHKGAADVGSWTVENQNPIHAKYG